METINNGYRIETKFQFYDEKNTITGKLGWIDGSPCATDRLRDGFVALCLVNVPNSTAKEMWLVLFQMGVNDGKVYLPIEKWVSDAPSGMNK